MDKDKANSLSRWQGVRHLQNIAKSASNAGIQSDFGIWARTERITGKQQRKIQHETANKIMRDQIKFLGDPFIQINDDSETEIKFEKIIKEKVSLSDLKKSIQQVSAYSDTH